MDELAPIDKSLEMEHEEKTKVKNIQVRSHIDILYFVSSIANAPSNTYSIEMYTAGN